MSCQINNDDVSFFLGFSYCTVSAKMKKINCGHPLEIMCVFLSVCMCEAPELTLLHVCTCGFVYALQTQARRTTTCVPLC